MEISKVVNDGKASAVPFQSYVATENTMFDKSWPDIPKEFDMQLPGSINHLNVGMLPALRSQTGVDSILSLFLVLKMMVIQHPKSKVYYDEVCSKMYADIDTESCYLMVSNNLKRMESEVQDVWNSFDVPDQNRRVKRGIFKPKFKKPKFKTTIKKPKKWVSKTSTYPPYTGPQTQLTHAHNLPSSTRIDLKNKGITGYGKTKHPTEFYHAINTSDNLPKKKYYAKIFGSDLPPKCGIQGCSKQPKVLAHGYFSNKLKDPYNEVVLVPTCKTCNHRAGNDIKGQNFLNIQNGKAVLADPVNAQKFDGLFYTLDMAKSDPKVISRKGAGKGSGAGIDGFNLFPKHWNLKKQNRPFPKKSSEYNNWEFK